MKTQVEHISSVKKRLSVEIEAQEIDKQLDAAYRKLSKNTKIPGFRPGKVPRQMLESYFGAQVAEDVSQDLIKSMFPKALNEVQIYPVGPPILDKDPIQRGQDFKFTAEMEIRPKIELPVYTGLEVQREIVGLAEEDYERQLQQVRQANGRLEAVDPPRPLQNDDYAVVDYEAFEGDQPLEGFSAENFSLKVGTHQFNPDVEAGMLGMNKGEEKEITVRFDENSQQRNLAGKEIRFKIKLLDIKELFLPELDDAFAAGLNAGFETLEDLKTRMREGMLNREKQRVEQELKQRLMDKIADQVEIELPQVLVDMELQSRIGALKENLRRNGTDPEKVGLTDDKLQVDLRPIAEKRIKNMLILADIANEAGLKVEEEDLEEHFNRLSQTTGQDAGMLRKYYEAREMMDGLQQELLEEKTLNYLVEHANISEVERSALTAPETNGSQS